jgi:hypothetical protein
MVGRFAVSVLGELSRIPQQQQCNAGWPSVRTENPERDLAFTKTIWDNWLAKLSSSFSNIGARKDAARDSF